MADGIHEQLREIARVVDVAAGLLLAEMQVVGRPQHGRREPVAVRRDELVRLAEAIAVQVLEPVGIGVRIIDDRCSDAFSVGLDLRIEPVFQARNFGFERLPDIAVGVVIGSLGRPDARELEVRRITPRMGLGDVLTVTRDAILGARGGVVEGE